MLIFPVRSLFHLVSNSLFYAKCLFRLDLGMPLGVTTVIFHVIFPVSRELGGEQFARDWTLRRPALAFLPVPDEIAISFASTTASLLQRLKLSRIKAFVKSR
jgi:hypothetical protein